MKMIAQNKLLISLIIIFLLENLILTINHPKLFQISTEPERAVSNFYRWYLHDIYQKKNIENPIPTLNASGTYQLDSTETFEYLKKTDYFSSQYFGEMEKIYYFCNSQLEKVNVKRVEQQGSSPSEGLTDCDFLNGYPWTGGMGESIYSFEIIDSSIDIGDPNRASVLVRFYPFPSYASVDLDQKDNKWRISKIDVLFYDGGEGWRIPLKKEKDVPTYLPADYTETEIKAETRPQSIGDPKEVAIYNKNREDAKSFSTEVLRKNIINDGAKLMQAYSTDLALKVSAYLTEFEVRQIVDKDITKLELDLLNKYSPCWGIPNGQCME